MNSPPAMTPRMKVAYNKVGKALHGLPCDVGVIFLMTMITDLIRQSGRPEIWDGIEAGARAHRSGMAIPVETRQQ